MDIFPYQNLPIHFTFLTSAWYSLCRDLFTLSHTSAWGACSGMTVPGPEHSAWSGGGTQEGFVIERRVRLEPVKCRILVRYGGCLGFPITASYPIPVLSPVLWCISDWEGSRSPYVHPARNRGDCWDVCETVSLWSSRYPPEQAGWRMQLRFRGARVPGERCWHWVSASKRTDHKCQWPWTLGTHAIWTPLTRQGKGHLVTPARTQSRTATSSHCHKDIPLHPEIIFWRRMPRSKH